MKRLIQLVLLILLILSIYTFYIKYLKVADEVTINQDVPTNQNKAQVKDSESSNFIKNLKYEINIKENNYYNLASKLSEIIYQDGYELVKMKQVNGEYSYKRDAILFVESDEAIYNNLNHNTDFKSNIKIIYLDNIIYAENMSLDFEKNLVTIFDNVIYNGTNGSLNADKININLITKKINISMDEITDSVTISSNK